MSLVKEYKTYLQNNPEGYWFKCKLYGFGWVPATKQGWGVFITYVLFVIGLSVIAETTLFVPSQTVGQVIAPLLLATIVFILIMYRTGEPLVWQWGKKDGK